ncbi:MarR family winged helix-turn-helix transcriptional regulator [Pectinatus cerevisiiphilus]|uniref:MarR family transcriptional regulator n=1 Tax=Pectinatus cerevisiiphilus TaxID=86956 RepID=A0A4R3K3P0_9FIRM|nr:MarR family winged helix-turn-helix transcriptional regulator [Pectinatus cerevisiiphilus]TCS77344.1 MarR family transcriptional regulator [Pectinatus cerevisiiphilus]
MKKQINVCPMQASRCNCMNLRRASRAITQFYDDTLKPSGLTITQLSLLRHLEMVEVATISELAKMVQIDRTTLNRNMKPLIREGFIDIRQGKDSRTRQISLTLQGKDAAAKGWKLWKVAQKKIEKYMGNTELAKLVQLLLKLENIVYYDEKKQ